jgi:hypothetical protein
MYSSALLRIMGYATELRNLKLDGKGRRKITITCQKVFSYTDVIASWKAVALLSFQFLEDAIIIPIFKNSSYKNICYRIAMYRIFLPDKWI